MNDGSPSSSATAAATGAKPPRTPAELGMQLRLDAGRPMLALEGHRLVAGGELRRALFEVVEGQAVVDVAGGALAYRERSLRLRAIELALPLDTAAAAGPLRTAGLQVLRDRPRAGGLDLLLLVDGPPGTAAAPARARIAVAPDDDGMLLLVDEVIGLPALPRDRLEIAAAILAGLPLPGAGAVRALVRRATPVTAVLDELLAQHGWRAPVCVGVKVRDLSLARGECVLRAWSGALPDGWRPAKEPRRTVAAAVGALKDFAMLVADANGDVARRRTVEAHLRRDAAGTPHAPAVVPFMVDLLARTGAAPATLEPLLAAALAEDDQHLGVLSAAAGLAGLTATERAARLQRLAAAADADDDPWVAARTGIAAALVAEADGDLPTALAAAAAAVDADPTLAEASREHARLLSKSGDGVRALAVGRAALDRAGHGSVVDSAADFEATDRFAVQLAAIAREVESVDAARALLHRALRHHERVDALQALALLEATAGDTVAARAAVDRLRAVATEVPAVRVEVELLSAHLAELAGDAPAARSFLHAAHALAPTDARVAHKVAQQLETEGALDAAVATLAPVVDAWLAGTHDADTHNAARTAARLLVLRAQRAGGGDDAVRARCVLTRLVAAAPGDATLARLDAEARAALGDGRPLATVLLAEAAAVNDTGEAAGRRARAGALLAAAGDHADACDAWQAAWDQLEPGPARDVVNIAAWFLAARSAVDPVRLGALIARTGLDGLDLATVASSVLREAVIHVSEVTRQRAVLRVLAGRDEDPDDVQRWLDACRALPPAEAAAAYCTAARARANAAWLLEALQLLQSAGEPRQALDAALDALDAHEAFAAERAVLAAAFELAVAVDDPAQIDARAEALAAHGEPEDRRHVLRTRSQSHQHLVGDADRRARYRASLQAWVQAFPTDREALEPLVGLLLDHGELEGAVAVLDRACAAGAGAALHLLLSKTAAAARAGSGAVELRAHELLLGLPLASDVRARVEHRLVEVYVREGRPERAGALLSSQATRDELDDDARVALWLRAAQIHESGQQLTEAIAALERAVSARPDDGGLSERLRTLCRAARDDHALARECARRAARLPPGPERSALLVEVGDVARSAARLDDARRAWLAATRRAFSAEAWARLEELATQTGSARLVVRGNLAVARAWGSTAPADAVAHIAAAATCLARDLGRSGLAIRVLEAGERFAAAQGVDDRQFALPLVDLLQAAGDGAGARARLDGLVERAAGSARARLLERRAVVAAALLGDDDAAINDRRAALWFDPTAAESARALARQLRARGDARGAIDVERALIDATLEGTERAAAYGALAAVAARDLGDDGATVTDDLCEAALRGGARLDVMRLQLAARERLGDPARLRTTLALLSRQALPADEQRAVAGRLADLCETDGAYGEAADALLRVEEAGPSNLVASDDQRTARLLGLLDRAGRLVEAADAVLRALKAWPEGSPLLGTRATLLLRAARWLDDGDRARAADALGLLGQAASLTRLDDEDEQRRATLAERQERPDIAIAALEQLVTRGVDVEHTALRLAAAAEAWGEPERALTAWQLRASRIPDDLLAWRAVERLAAATGDPAALQGARERLVTLADGAADEQAARALACARDARDRLGDVTAALAWLDRARALAASPTIRRESLVMAVAADDATAELTVLDEMVAAADPLSVEERTRRASLRLAAADSTAAFQTILDDAQFVIAAGATPAAVTAITAVLTAVTRRSPDVVVATLLAHPSAALRDAVVSAMPTLPPGALDDEAIVSLADRFPEAPSFARAAARREQASGQLIAAADRLLAVAVRHAHDADLVRATVDEAAAIVCDTGATALADRLEDLRPALRRHSTLRAAAVDALGHDGRWESVALLLDDALVLTDSRAERRALRLQLAAVLHHGLTTAPALLRAADHLDALVADDPEDVEAWDALLACLERSGDHDRLQAALAERAAMAQGPLRRMLVVRRGTLLLALDRGHEALDALRATRRDGDDHEQKDLERRIHAAVDARDADAALRDGGPATARFLDNELTRQPDVDDARALLALPPGAVPPGARVRARLALLVLLDGESAESHARNLLAPGGGLDALARADEAVAVLDGAARSNDSRVRGRAKGLAAAVARTASVIGSRAALRLADGLRALDDEVQSTLTIDEAFGGATAARRWRLHGPRAVEADGAFLTGRAGAALGFRRAARLADRETLHRMARSLGVDVASVGSGEAARASLQASAQQQQHTVARGVAGDLTLLRLGDRRGAARVAARSADARASVTRRARVMPLTVRRLEARLELARLVDQPVDDVLVELGAIAAVAQANASAIERRALDAAFAVRAPGSHALVRRAELACANDDVDAVDWCERAADAAEGLAELEEAATRLRRHAIAARLQQNQRDALGRQLRAFARSGGRHGGPAMDARRAEALSVAEAAGMLDVVDGIMADAVEGTASVEERVGAVRRRAQLRLTVRQPREAFRVLVDGAALAGPFAGPLRDEAYALAASEALIDDMLEVVDDDLARAGLLAVVGRRAEATALAATLDDPAALWLLADCAQRAGDPAAEERALANLAARGLADDALSQRLVDAAAARGAADEAARRALGRLASATVDPARLQAAVVRLQDVPAAERSSVARALLDLAADARRRGVVAAGVERLFAAARSVADQLAPVDDGLLQRDAARVWADHVDTDAAWIDVVDLALDRDIASLRATLVGLWPRAGVVRGVVGRLDTPLRAAAFAGVIRAAIVEGDDDGVSRALTDQPGLPWTVVDALAAAHEAAGQPREAAQVLERALRAVGPDPAASDLPRREALRRASVLLQDADAAGAAARLLQGARAEDLDDATLRLACDVIFAAARGGATGDAALLAARVARLTGDDRFRVRAIGMADAAGGDVALHVGRWCLAARDVRALPLLAHHCLEQSPAQGFFGAWHALRSGVQQFAPHAPPGFATIAGWRESLKRLPPAPALSPHRSALQRARLNRRPSRADAWADHAAELAFADQTAAARALARSGRSPSACSLVVRLAFDAVLAAGPARARAIADGLASVPPSLRGPIVDEFDRLSAAGATSARQRRQVDALAARARAVVDIAIDDAALGRAVDVPAVLRSLGRRPPASTRTAAAALLALLGLEPLAAAVMPTVSSPPPVTTPRTARAPGTDGEIDDVVRLGRLRLAQLGGPRLDVEEEILAIAERLGRTTIVAQSLHHLACLAPTPAERAHHLLRRAELLRQRQPERSWRSAVAAHQLNPGEQSARLLLVLADVGGIAVRREQALAAWGAHASAADDRVAAALEHARIVATDGADPARAVALLRAAARRTPRAALFRERSRLARAALNDERAAALADLEAAAEASDLDAASRLQLLRPAAAVLAAHGDAESVERAVAALCLAHEQGDATALAEAEPLARSRLGPSALARVLDLRLRDIEDDLTRRGLTLERAQLLRQLDDWSGALALLEAHAVADEQDVDARLQLGRWYLEDRRVLDAALAYESAARVAGLAVEVCGPAAREAAVLLAAVGALDRAGPLADLAVNVGFADLQVITVAEAWHRSRENWIAVDELLGRELTFVDDPRRAAHIWMERAVVRRERTTDDAGARKALARVLELVPDHPRALEMARDDARKTDTWDILRAALLRASETTTARHARAGLLREIAVIDADQLGDVRAALALVDRALDLVPEDVDAMVAKAVWMVRVGQVDGVAALMEQIELAGGDASRLPGQLHLVRGDALVVAGDVVAARIAFRRAVEDPESAAKAWDRLIDMAWGTPEALTLLADARRSTVESARHAELSRKELRLRTNLGDVDGAVAAAVTLLRHEPGDAEALKVARDPLLTAGRAPEFFELLIAWARSLDGHTAANERAARLAQTGAFALDELRDEAAARSLFDEALALHPDEPVALVRLADTAWAARDDERGLELLDRIAPEVWLATPAEDGARRELAELLYRRARCAYALGNADVKERLRLVLRQDARHVRGLDMLSRVAAEVGDDDASEFALEALSTALSPRDDATRLGGALVELAQLRLRRGKSAEAIAAAEAAFAVEPDALTVLEVLAETREVAGHRAAAAEAWRRVAALKSGGERRKALERGARGFVDAGRHEDAARTWFELFQESNDPRHRSEGEACAARGSSAAAAPPLTSEATVADDEPAERT